MNYNVKVEERISIIRDDFIGKSQCTPDIKEYRYIYTANDVSIHVIELLYENKMAFKSSKIYIPAKQNTFEFLNEILTNHPFAVNNCGNVHIHLHLESLNNLSVYETILKNCAFIPINEAELGTFEPIYEKHAFPVNVVHE